MLPEYSQTIFLETEVVRLTQLKSQCLPPKVRIFNREEESEDRASVDPWDWEDQQHITVYVDQPRPDLRFLEGDAYPQVGLLLLFRSHATSYLRYPPSERNRSSGISCALLVEWRGDVAERIGTATATYDFFEEVSAQREVVKLQWRALPGVLREAPLRDDFIKTKLHSRGGRFVGSETDPGSLSHP